MNSPSTTRVWSGVSKPACIQAILRKIQIANTAWPHENTAMKKMYDARRSGSNVSRARTSLPSSRVAFPRPVIPAVRTGIHPGFALACLVALTTATLPAMEDQPKPAAQPSVLEEGAALLRNDQKSTIGYKFTAARDLRVVGLGVLNLDGKGGVKGAGLDQPVRVGLWDSAGELLASSTISQGTGAGEKIASETIEPVSLKMDHEYYVGALFAPLSEDYFRNSGMDTESPVFTTDIFAVSPVYTEKEPGLIFPEFIVNQPGRAYLGPVLLFSPTN